jgi:hypothetical protein
MSSKIASFSTKTCLTHSANFSSSLGKSSIEYFLTCTWKYHGGVIIGSEWTCNKFGGHCNPFLICRYAIVKS